MALPLRLGAPLGVTRSIATGGFGVAASMTRVCRAPLRLDARLPSPAKVSLEQVTVKVEL